MATSALARQANPAFRRTDIPVGTGPKWVAVADVNRDGIPDIVVANSDSGTVSVLLGRTTGQFVDAQGSPFPAGHLPNDVAVADMNGDGNLDLVVANHQAPYVTILLGDGHGIFRNAPGTPIDVHSKPHPHGVAVADFNGDGKPDIVTDSWGSNQIELLLGDGKGGLHSPGQYFSVGKRPYERLRTADFNKDGRPDVVTTNLDDGTVSVLLGDGRGGFHESSGSPFLVNTKPWQVAIADIDGDGNLDLIVIPYQPSMTSVMQDAVVVLLGDGKGAFHKMDGSPLSLAGCDGADSVAAADLTGSGHKSILVSCAKTGNLMLFEQGPADTFRGFSYPSGKGWGSVTAARLAPGSNDSVITANGDDGTITIFASE